MKHDRQSGHGRVKRPGSSVMPRGPSESVGRPGSRKRFEEPGTRDVRVHVNRLGGRSRLDASRVFRAGRSQGLVEREVASREEARSTA